MTTVGLVFLALAATFCFFSCIGYARCSWHTNNDLMGASLAFFGPWLLSSVLLALGLETGLHVPVWSSLLAAFVWMVVGKVIEWFVIERILRRLFRGYRHDPALPRVAADVGHGPR